MSDILRFLKEKKSTLEYSFHPFSERDVAFKYAYCFGVGVMSIGNMKAITETKNSYESFLKCIKLPESLRTQIISDINNSFDYRIGDVFKKIGTKNEQYCFIIDLYKIYEMSEWSKDYCHEIIQGFMEVFRLSKKEIYFFDAFFDAYIKRNGNLAAKAYYDFLDSGYTIEYSYLTYLFPTFLVEEEYEDVIVEAGDTIVFDKKITIEGCITVKRGGSLLIRGANVNMRGSINVIGGRIEIMKSHINIMSCEQDVWLKLNDTAVVRIYDSDIDCHGCCGALDQNTGRLIMRGSRISGTSGVRAITFNGISASITSNCFYNSDAGIIFFGGNADADIKYCDFINTSADYGGAVYSDTIGDISFESCKFERCKAKYLGAAIYFKNQKLGQSLISCVNNECTPEKDVFFNVEQEIIKE